MSTKQHITIHVPRLLDRRQCMAKNYRHIGMSVVFAVLAVFTVSIGFVEGGASLVALAMVGATLLALVLLFGIPINFIEFRELRVEFEHWGPSYPRGGEDSDDE